MTPIIEIKNANDFLAISWMIGARCNYDCSYCGPSYHNSTEKPHSLAKLKKAWKNLFSKIEHSKQNIKLHILGGEPTINKSLIPWLSWIREEYPKVVKILVTTNGSATYNLYEKLSKVVDTINFSMHREFIDEDKFFNKVIKLNSTVDENKLIWVWVMQASDKDKKWFDILEKNNIKYFKQRVVDWSIKEPKIYHDKFENHSDYDCQITLQSGEKYSILCNEVSNRHLGLFKDWMCVAGSKRLFVDQYFNIFSCEGRNNKLGNLLMDWKPLTEPVACRKDFCFCTDDLQIDKWNARVVK